MKPENPAPLQTVTLTLESYTYDLDRSKITWSVDGQNKTTDLGLREFTVQAGKNGHMTTVKAQVQTQQDGTVETEISFIPSAVDLIYESQSYTPPFYKGRSLNPNQGKVLVAAIPELIKTTGEKISSKSIIYSWKKNGTIDQSASGMGKDTFTFTGSVPIRDSVVEVTASSLDGTLTASKEITITNVDPKIIFYEDSPVYGIMMNKAIKSTVKMLTDEFSIFTAPYFFSTGYANTQDLDYTWSMNGKDIDSQDPKNSFTARVDKAGSGTANISLKISNNLRIFQIATNSYSINFEKQ